MDSSEIKSLQKALKHRKAELEKLIQQMRSDQLNKSTVYKKMEAELGRLESELDNGSTEQK